VRVLSLTQLAILEESLLEKALFKPERDPVTHWKPRMRLRYSIDDHHYPVRSASIHTLNLSDHFRPADSLWQRLTIRLPRECLLDRFETARRYFTPRHL
jgi:hypothetical protein